MAKFSRKTKGGIPAINTASLSDIVFMLLFFFMLTAQVRKFETKVTIRVPEASEVVKLERKDLASYISIGVPTLGYQTLYGDDAQVQLNDSFKSVDDIRDFIAAEREARSEVDRPFMTTVLKVDQNVRMGVVTDVKQELRRCSALRIFYSARRTGQ
ncbi:MAG: biopolymer transporter ExbD [Bacteroidales bacterium]|nr:biopolymer transporter ExbD [Bacteroidales bacterium]MCL2738894.1 biopolymer transporter ExbD [Bacteroidales bacterium]